MKKYTRNSEIPASTKIKFEESEENDSSSEETDDEEARIESELADVPFEELHKARSDGSLAIPLRQKRDPENKPKRANKNRPMEVSCKRPVSRYREVVQVPKQVARDPRFESLCGTFDEEGFKKRYNFIYEEGLPAEKEELKKLLRSTKDPKGIEDLKNRISMIDKQLKSDSTKLRKNQILSEQKRRVREAVKQGKCPFYFKKSEIRERVNIEKYENLKASGKLDSYMEKKRRRTAAKDHRLMPYRMSNKNE